MRGRLWDLPVFPENRGGLGVGWLAEVDMRQVRMRAGAVQQIYDRSRGMHWQRAIDIVVLWYSVGPGIFILCATSRYSGYQLLYCMGPFPMPSYNRCFSQLGPATAMRPLLGLL